MGIVTCEGLATAVTPGPEVGLRAGYAYGGEHQTGANVRVRLLGTQERPFLEEVLPLWLDAGYRVAPRLMLGAYLQYAVGLGDDRFDTPVRCDGRTSSCSADDIRTGIQIHYHPEPDHFINVWFGLGLGYEWLHLRLDDSRADAPLRRYRLTAQGFELANIQTGWDIPVGQGFAVGPAVSLSFNRFHQVDLECSGETCPSYERDTDDSNPTIHSWLFLGIRGVYLPNP